MTERRLIAVQGIVQGVGFRPFVYNLATALDLRGRVRNDAAGVLVDVEGEREALESFLRSLTTRPPPLAAIEAVSSGAAAPGGYREFRIAPSEAAAECAALVSPDVATCDDCVAELFDLAGRRFRYPFISCAHCGPRLTIVREVPYDRQRTTMARFPLCQACRREYEDPSDRRFHAQAIACPDCGPTLALVTPRTGGLRKASGDVALEQAVLALRDGEIVGVKGLGGWHLACDAANGEAVRRLRARKGRDAKPLAVMVGDLAGARALCRLGDAEAALLGSPARPIVLLAKRSPCTLSGEVAPGIGHLGLMLPYTPLHHLLLAGAARPLVMTSGNRSGEPIAWRDDDALERLATIGDRILMHDRPIATRCDDSVARVVRGAATCLRHSRGFAPRPIRLAVALPLPVLGVGGHLKNAFCLARGERAFLSHHVGDLESAEAYGALAEGIAHYRRLFDIDPEVVGHDLHPDYLSTRLAHGLDGIERVPVQHHHAHVASCLAEHGVTEPVIGVVFDGAGLGSDGAIWGGEFLLADDRSCERVAHLAYVPLPGGDAAARQPWRMAAAHLWAAYGGEVDRLSMPFLQAAAPGEASLLIQMLRRGVHCPPTSSVGRLFDAVASLAGLRQVSRYEGEAAMELEATADRGVRRSYAVDLRETAAGWAVDTSPLVRQVVDDVAAGRPAAEIAGVFHNAVRDLVVETAERIRRRTGVRRATLTGGVFQNALLAQRTAEALTGRGFEVLLHRRVPCNDGGLALGQSVIAARAAASSRNPARGLGPSATETLKCV